MEIFNRGESKIFTMEIDEHTKHVFLEMARWTKFLAILGFIGIGLMILLGVFAAIAMTMLPAGYNNPFAGIGAIGIVLFFVVSAAFVIYPIMTLYKYSTNVKLALNTNDRQKFDQAIVYLKNTFKYYGIFMIIMMCLYGLGIVFGGVAALTR